MISSKKVRAKLHTEQYYLSMYEAGIQGILPLIEDIDFLPQKNAENKHILGRPVFNGKDQAEVVAKLQFALSIGSTTKEACIFAGISTDSYYRYSKNRPAFRNEMEYFKTALALRARYNIAKAICDDDVQLSKWYLERRVPEEFSTSSPGIRMQQLQEKIDHLESMLSVAENKANKLKYQPAELVANVVQITT